MKVLVFGRLVEMIGEKSVEIPEVDDTASLQKTLHRSYPALAGAAYCIAVDKNVVSENTMLTEHSEVALLPQYAGG